MNPRQQAIVNSLSPPEREQLAQVLEYLGEKAGPGNPSGYMGEGSIAALFNRQSPRIQVALKAIDMFAETPRFEPFQPKRSEAERFHELGLDPETSVTIKAALDAQHVASELQSRMGNDADQPDTSEPSTRELLSAAADFYEGAENHG